MKINQNGVIEEFKSVFSSELEGLTLDTPCLSYVYEQELLDNLPAVVCRATDSEQNHKFFIYSPLAGRMMLVEDNIEIVPVTEEQHFQKGLLSAEVMQTSTGFELFISKPDLSNIACVTPTQAQAVVDVFICFAELDEHLAYFTADSRSLQVGTLSGVPGFFVALNNHEGIFVKAGDSKASMLKLGGQEFHPLNNFRKIGAFFYDGASFHVSDNDNPFMTIDEARIGFEQLPQGIRNKYKDYSPKNFVPLYYEKKPYYLVAQTEDEAVLLNAIDGDIIAVENQKITYPSSEILSKNGGRINQSGWY